jgi:hypothetical protein
VSRDSDGAATKQDEGALRRKLHLTQARGEGVVREKKRNKGGLIWLDTLARFAGSAGARA